jgi:transglutaminase-like putative cysteine protease
MHVTLKRRRSCRPGVMQPGSKRSMAQHVADSDNPLVQATAVRLLQGCSSPRERLQRLVSYVRDDILFGFPPYGDMTAASDTIRMGIGQCNTKGTLLLALCQAAGIPARLHFAPIRKNIQRGLYTGIWYELLPKYLSHAWVEVKLRPANFDVTAGPRDFLKSKPMTRVPDSTSTQISSSRWTPSREMTVCGPSLWTTTALIATATAPVP